MPEYRQNRSGAIWVVERSWRGVREDLKEHERYGEDASAFIVRTSSAAADEARADEHPETRTVFLAQGSTDAAASELGGPHEAAYTPLTEEPPTPEVDATSFADDAPASEELDPLPDEVPESVSEPRQEGAARKEPKRAGARRLLLGTAAKLLDPGSPGGSTFATRPEEDSPGATVPMRLVIAAAVLVAAVIAGSLFVLQPRNVEPPPLSPEEIDEAIPQEDPDQIADSEEAPGESVADRNQSAQELPVPRPQAEDDASRRALERQVQALQARLAALEDSGRNRPATPEPEPSAAAAPATPADEPTPPPPQPEPQSPTPRRDPPPPDQTTPDPDATTQALLQQMQSLQEELTRLTRLEGSDTGDRTQPESHASRPPLDERPATRTSQEQPVGSAAATPPAPVGPGGTPAAVPPQASEAQPAEPAGPVNVSGAMTKPVRLHYVEPNYPRTARRMRIQGSVILRATIDKAGNVTDVEVLKGLSRGLSEAAVAAVKQWKYEPATLNGKPIAVYYNLTVHFRI